MKRILFVIDSLNGGGAEKGLVNLINSLDTSKYKITLLLMNSRFDRIKEIKNDIELKVMAGSGRLFTGKKCKIGNVEALVKCFERNVLRKLINVGEYDVEFLFMDSLLIKLITGSSDDTIRIIRLANDYSKPLEKFMDIEPTESGYKRHFSYYSKIDYVVSPSNYVLETFKNRTGISENLLCIYNINKCEELIEATNDSVTDITKTKFTICSVGRLTKDKGALRIVDIAKRLNDTGIDYEWWIIGKGECEVNIRKAIEEHKLNNIKLLGYKSNPFKYMKLADLYVSPSYLEGLSNSAKEAMLLGLPCVVTDCSGMAEIFGENSEYGLITDNTDEALYNGIKKMICEKDVYDYYKKSVILRSDFFNPEKSLREYEKLFNGRGNYNDN